MPKQLINTIGLVVVVAIFAIGIAFIAVPLILQGASTLAETGRVQQANAVQQTAIEALAAQSENAELEDDLTDLQVEIPATPKVYTVSELIGNAAAETGVTITSITPNAPVAFNGSGAPAATDRDVTDINAPITGRVQIPVQIAVLAADQAAVIEFIDRLREGPRLLGNINAIITSRGGASASIDALAFAEISAD